MLGKCLLAQYGKEEKNMGIEMVNLGWMWLDFFELRRPTQNVRGAASSVGGSDPKRPLGKALLA